MQGHSSGTPERPPAEFELQEGGQHGRVHINGDWKSWHHKGLSFDSCAVPSLSDVINGAFKKLDADGNKELTNASEGFLQNFTLVENPKGVYEIRIKSGVTMFLGALDGVPKYAMALDLGADGDQDVVMWLSAYGNHGNGTDSFEVFMQDQGELVRLEGAINFCHEEGKDRRVGHVVWHESPRMIATIEGEEADEVDNPSLFMKFREVWGYDHWRMLLLDRAVEGIARSQLKMLTFR